jgi:hypothetical protein
VDKLEPQLRPKLILLPLDAAGIDASSLQSGRLPEAGRDQVVAGASADHKDRVRAGERDLEVVGVLKPDSALLRNDYLIAPSDAANALFPEGDSSVHAATIVQLTSEQFHDRQVLEQLEKSLPDSKYTKGDRAWGVHRSPGSAACSGSTSRRISGWPPFWRWPRVTRRQR